MAPAAIAEVFLNGIPALALHTILLGVPWQWHGLLGRTNDNANTQLLGRTQHLLSSSISRVFIHVTIFWHRYIGIYYLYTQS